MHEKPELKSHTETPPIASLSNETLVRLRQLFDSATPIVWIKNIDGVCVSLNERAAAFLHKVDEFSVPGLLTFMHPADVKRLWPVYADAISQRSEYQLEYRIIRSDGSFYWAMVTGAPRFGADNEFLGYTGCIVDVTDRYALQEEKRKSETSLRLLMDNSSDLITHHAPNGVCIYASPASECLLGYAPAELIGKHINELVHHDDVKAIDDSISTQARYDSEDSPIEIRLLHKKGHFVWTGSRIKALVDPVTKEEIGTVTVSRDITFERKAKEELRRREERFRSLAFLSSDWFWECDDKGRYTFVSEGITKRIGILPQNLLGKTRVELLSEPSQPGINAYLDKFAKREMFRDLRYSTNPADSAGKRVIAISGEPVFEGTAFIGYRGVSRDITAEVLLSEEYEKLATHDTLTGLPNRTFLNLRLQEMLDTAPRGEVNAVMFIDLDHFKKVNDSMGHIAGDNLLVQVATRLKDALRPGDLVARLGGDEFVVVAHCKNGAETAAKIADKLLSLLTAPFEIEDQELFIGGSIGISLFPTDGKTKEVLFQNADTAMYEAKNAGRNGYRLFKDQMSVEAKRRVFIEHSLRRALERDEFELHFQPRLNLRTREVVGAEALIRWNHPQLGMVSPGEFIPVAEERGYIEAIGEWVLLQACMQAQDLMSRSGKPLHISVNLSVRQLRSPNIIAQVQRALAQNRFPAHLLELEITESALVVDLEKTVAVLKSLKALGVTLSVDDFGTGYSGMAYLRKFPIDTLKLDRSFIVQADDGMDSAQFIKAFVDLAHALNLAVVAEGIETQENAGLVQAASCDEGQGYFFARPMPMADLEKFLQKAVHLP